MKVITFVVPCFNSAEYMEKCINSLLLCDGGECGVGDIEIIIINDGSTDNTAEIADRYARDFAGVIKVVHQENAGHGGAINAGLAAASGIYFKVVDSDDYLDKSAYTVVMEILRRFVSESADVDLVVSNYVYEKIGRQKHKVINYRSALPKNRIIGWKDTRRFAVGKYLLMHSLICKTSVLRLSGLVLLNHTFYVDNLFAFVSLMSVKTLYYADADLYRYSIGLEGQSVKETTMIKRIDQQIAVNRLMLENAALDKIENKKQLDYMLRYLEIVTSVSMILLIRANTEEGFAKKDMLWAYIKNFPIAYGFLRRSWMIRCLCRMGAVGRFLSVITYQFARLVYGFN